MSLRDLLGMIMWITLMSCIALASATCQNAPPQVIWPSEYTVRGVLNLPHAEIREPFLAYYSTRLGASRIDYYGGTVKTYQLTREGINGTIYKVVPETTEEVMNQLNCMKKNVSEENTTVIQTVMPDLSGFTCLNTNIVDGIETQKWTKEVKNGEKVSRYAMKLMWKKSTTNDVGAPIPIPVMYETEEFDALLGENFGHYYINYELFMLENPPADVFVVSNNATCGGSLESGNIARMNPMKEYIHSYSDHIKNDFHSFIKQHGKNYNNVHEHSKRFEIFRQNHRYINSMNRANLGFKLSINHLADRSDEELAALGGLLHSTGYNGGQPFPYNEQQMKNVCLPENHDWRLYGAVTQVKDQVSCGSCYSFGVTGNVEGAYFLKTGNLERLSSQALMDCSWGFGNKGCDGGFANPSYRWIMKHGGIPSEYEYGGYLGLDGNCHLSGVKMLAPIKGWVNVTVNDEKALKMAIYKHGPISVEIDSSPKTFHFYANGVYYDKNCKNKPHELDHSVLVVGYGVMNGKKYWLVKNSWSHYWGNNGYILMASKDNNCGVMTSPTYVIM